MSRAVAWPMLTAESGIDRYFKEIQRFPMLDRGKNTSWLSAGVRAVIEMPRTGSSLAICGSSPRSPGAIAATVCRSLT